MLTNKLCLYSLVVLLSVLIISGCESLDGKFTASESVNISGFTDYTISIMSNSNLGVANDKAIYTREFFDPSGKEELEFEELLNKAETMFKRLIGYSVTLVTISEMHDNDLDRIEAYAQYLEKLQANAEQNLRVEPDYYKDIIANIRKQETFLEALRQAQPIMDGVGRYGELLLIKIEDSAKVLALKVDSKIDEEYKRVIAFQKGLDKEKYEVLEAQALLYRTYKGDMEAFEKFRNSHAIISKDILPEGEPTEEQLEVLFNHLMTRLNAMHEIWKEIEPDWKNYRETHKELKILHNQVVKNARNARLFVLLWLRAHNKMASGVTNPAEWFSIDEAPTLLFDYGKDQLL